MSSHSREAFAALIKPHFDRLFRLACRLAGNRADAEDLLQDVMLKLYERKEELSSIRDLSPWLGRVLYNQFIDQKRRYGRAPVKLVGDVSTDLDPEDLASETMTPPEAVSRAEALNHLSAMIRRLSEEHRVVLLMHDTEGFTLAEIEEVTGTPVGTLKSRLHRARARIRELLHTAAQSDGTLSHSEACSSVDGVGNDAL